MLAAFTPPRTVLLAEVAPQPLVGVPSVRSIPVKWPAASRRQAIDPDTDAMVSRPAPGRSVRRFFWPSTTYTAPSAALRTSTPATTIEVGPVTQQLVGCSSAELSGRLVHGAGPF